MTNGLQSFGDDGFGAYGRSELLRLVGPHIQVLVGSPKSAPVGINTDFLQLDALIDTGADDVCIDIRTAERLNLVPVDKTTIGGVGGVHEAIVVAALLEVPNLRFKRIVNMYAPIDVSLSSKMLLGRSFLSNYIVTFDGPNGMFHFFDPRIGLAAPVDDE